MSLPKTLKNFNVFVDGRGLAGVASEVNLPKLSLKTEEHRAGGMDAPTQIDMGMEKMECDFTLSEYNPEVLKLFGLLVNSPTHLTLRGALVGGAGEVTPVVVNLWGNIKEVDPGSWKAGEKTQCKFTVALTYYKLTIGDEEIHEIDTDSMIRVIGGVDQLAAVREAIGQ